MKKLLFGVTATIAFTTMSFGQITLEHSYSTKLWQYDQTNAFKTTTGLKYYTLDNSANILKIYNDTHTLIKTVNIPIDTDFSLQYLYAISDKLFNSDDLIEFIVASESPFDPVSGTTHKLTLLNEDGVVLQQFGNKNEAYIIKGDDNTFKLIAVSDPYGFIPSAENFEYDVYSLPGTTLNVFQNKPADNSFFGFPNPTSNRISITNSLQNGENGILEVFDINGKVLLQKNVSGSEKEISIDVTNFSNGVYIYKLGGKTNRFIKKQ